MSRRLALAILILLLLLVGADQGARLVAQASLAGRLQGELRLVERPAVRLGGFPFLLHLARQRFPRARLEARDATFGGFRFSRITLELERVRFSFQTGEIRSAGGTGELAVDERGAEEYLSGQGISADVAFLGPGVRVGADVDGIRATADGRIRLRGRRLVFQPTNAQATGGAAVPAAALSFEVRLPELAGVEFRSARVEHGRVVVRVALRDGALPLR